MRFNAFITKSQYRASNPNYSTMMNFFFRFILITVTVSSTVFQAKTQTFEVSARSQVQAQLQNQAYSQLISQLLVQDIRQVFGVHKAKVKNQIILRIASEASKDIPLGVCKAIDAPLKNKWEVFSYKIYQNKLIISGSDKRGLAYGVFTLSEKIGVSPWYFWADVPIQKRSKPLIVTDTISTEPSVKYRGIFINDEDWGLQPWAAKTFDPNTKDIGPKTYAKVFELLLRLKANLIWPAMHPSTKAFYHYPDNKIVADLYGIVVGTSHAEPMMRNNVDEWIDSTMGEYNYVKNKNKLTSYWSKRLEEVKNYENLYTIGMRGKHDSGMEGIKTQQEAIQLTQQIIAEQRTLLSQILQRNSQQIPQVLTLYKEVLELYKAGLQVPDDITLIWPDDNYGYIKNLNNPQEQTRAGGSGVYYHASYWGRPHDYLWIGTTHPALLRFEMQKAYQLNNRQVWVLNIGDLKPQEYPTQLFLDMAYHLEPFKQGGSVQNHLAQWCKQNLGNATFATILWQNYQLAFARKPEFMGWSRTEPTTSTKATAFTQTEVLERLQAFEALETQVNALQPQDSSYRASYFQLVSYPILAASQMNKKFLYLDLYYRKAPTERTDQDENYQKALQAYQAITTLTQQYNSGKWANMMSMSPRNLPVFKSPMALKNVPQKIDAPSLKTLVLPAGAFVSQQNFADSYWEKIPEPSFSGNALVSKPFTQTQSIAPQDAQQAWVTYELDIEQSGTYRIKVQAVPLHPLHRKLGQKIAVSIDQETTRIIDFETFDRSEEWKENVLGNKTVKEVQQLQLKQGKHQIRLKMIDAGVLIDQFLIEQL